MGSARGSSSLLLFTQSHIPIAKLKRELNAEIAQLVEHNLAKVGVASSSLVFRSSFRHSFFHSIRVSEAVSFLTHFFVISV